MRRTLALAMSVALLLLSGSLFAAQPNGGLLFNGTSDYVQCTTGTVQALTGNFTIEAWVLPTGYTGVARRIVSNFQSAPGRGWGLGNSKNNSWRFTTFGVKDFDTTTGSFIVNKWTHFALAFASETGATTATFYLNGKHAMSVPWAVNCRESTAALCIGANPILTEFWLGQIDELRIWNTLRTEAEIQANMHSTLVGNEPGLVCYYPMDEHTGTTTEDLTGDTSGTIHGATWGVNSARDWVNYP